MATMNIPLADQMKEWVESRSANGRYANSSDDMRDPIRRDLERADAIASLTRRIRQGWTVASPRISISRIF